MKHGDARLRIRALGVAWVGLAAGCVNAPERPGSPEDPVDEGRSEQREPSGTEATGLPDDGDQEALRHCRVPNVGCACDPELDAPVECHSDAAIEDEHGRLRCLVGERSCEGGVWGACAFFSEFEVPQAGERAFGDPPAACPNCDPSCYEIDDDFTLVDPGPLQGSGIIWDGPSGGVIISGGGGGAVSFPYAYIGLENTNEVAKIDTASGTQVGRYAFGVAGAGASSDPSRTAVDTIGDVYVAMRARDGGGGDWQGFDGTGDWASVAKIAGDVAQCVDVNANTVIDTSTNDVAMAIGTDECVLWEVTVNTNPGGHLRGVVVDRGDVAQPNGYPWVAGQQNPDGFDDEPGVMYQLDPDTGAILQRIPLPLHVYGSVIDGGTPQRIWFTSRRTGRLAALVLDAVPYVEGPFAPPLPNCTGDPMNAAYGIGIDSSGRIWRGSWTGCPTDYLTGYDPGNDTWCLVSPGFATSGLAVRVNDDGSNTVFAAVPYRTPGRLVWFDPAVACVAQNINDSYCNDWPDEAFLDRYSRDDGCDGSISQNRSVDVYPGGSISGLDMAGFTNTHGVGIAADGRVWVQNRAGNNIRVHDPDGVLPDVTYPVAGAFGQPYSYSDFTGYSRNSFTLGGTAELFREYGVLDPACAPGSSPVWGDLSWTAVTINSHIDFFAQVATDPTLLDAAPRTSLGSAPIDASPIFVNDLLPPNLRFAQYIRIIASLESDDGVTSPIMQSLGLDWSCQESE